MKVQFARFMKSTGVVILMKPQYSVEQVRGTVQFVLLRSKSGLTDLSDIMGIVF